MKKFILITLCLNLAFAAHSQKTVKNSIETFTPSWYVGANGGLNWFLGENNYPFGNPISQLSMTQNMGYLGRLELGYHFSPIYSLRSFLGYRLNNYYNSTVTAISSENLAVDFLVNLTNIKNYNPDNKLTFSLFAGLGANYINSSPVFPVAGSLRGGLQTDYNLTSQLALNLIIEGSVLTDNYNKAPAGTPIDLEAAVSLGLSYRLPSSAKKQFITTVIEPEIPEVIKPEETPVVITPEPEKPMVAQDTVKPVEVPEVVKPVEPQPETIATTTDMVTDKINEHVFFTINQREIQGDVQKSSMQRIADFIAAHPESKVIISGYADRGTGTVEVNNMISKQRAVIVANTLIREYGVSYKNIWVRWFGSGVQPYAKAYQNRLVIVRGAVSFKEANAIPALKRESTSMPKTNSELNTNSNTNSTTKPETKPGVAEVQESSIFKIVHFSESSVEITNQKEKEDIKLVAEYLKRNPASMVTISGYADKDSDGEKKCTQLSKDRAEAVANTLINTYSINAERIQARWYGAQKENGLTPTMNKMVLINTVK